MSGKQFLCLMLASVACIGCTPSVPLHGTEGDSTATSEVEDTSAASSLIVDGICEYVIVRPHNAEESVISAATFLRDEIKKRCGVDLKMKTDLVREGSTMFQESPAEILVGVTEREITATLGEKLPGSADWGIVRDGEKIAIYASDALSDAVDYFISHYVQEGNIVIPDGETYLSPATYRYQSITLGERDLRTIGIYFVTSANGEKDAAEYLRDAIRDACGYDLPVSYRDAIGDEAGIYIETVSGMDTRANCCYYKDGKLMIQCDSSSSPIAAASIFSRFLETGSETLAIGDSFHLTDERFVTGDAAYLHAIDERAEEMKTSILQSASDYSSSGTVYYFSADGDDAANGKSEATPKRTLSALRNLSLKEGDTVLFRRGDTFRGTVETRCPGVTYSAYGEGNKPIVTASEKNYADPSLWQKTAYPNVWQLKETIRNVGIIVLDHTGEVGVYDAQVAVQKISGVDNFRTPADLTANGQFYSDLASDKLYFYHDGGNPGEVYRSVEIGGGKSVFSGVGDGITVDNLHITVTGCHGVGYGDTKNLTVRNCVFDYIGGSVLTGTTRYGNAVQIWGGCDGFYVRDNWIYQIYDTAVTHQYMDENNHTNVVMQNIEVSGNLIEYCYWGIEYWNVVSDESTPRETRNVSYSGNFIRMTGYGFGTAAHPGHKIHHTQALQLGSKPNVTENFTVTDNIFDRTAGVLICVGYDLGYRFSNNTYIQKKGELYAQLVGGMDSFDGKMPAKHEMYLGETNATFVFLED